MKLRIEELPLGFGFRCIDDNTYDGAPDAGPQMVGEGKTPEAAKMDFWDQWMERECDRDMKAAMKRADVLDSVIQQLFGSRP